MLFTQGGAAPKVGLFAVNMRPTVGPGELLPLALLLEELGYESVWAGEHPVLPDPPTPDSPWDPRMPLVDPVVTLSFLAGVTTRLRLATGILLLPTRHPVVLAKQFASLDVLSGGRAILGFGMGYIPKETEVLGIGFEDRAARGEEHLAAMRALWHAQSPSFEGRYVRFDGIDAHPRPVQRALPVVAGGNTPAALRRAVTSAHGWYGWALTPQEVREHKEALRRTAERHGRPAELGPLEITVTPPQGPLGKAEFDRYREAGVDRLVIYPRFGLTVAELHGYVHDHAGLARAV
ncbi:TIGR03619 family F420-dependent LLM class oxidoreductase [Kitasatospora sp. NPDC093558]|uniref:TIGR03619 family F420-dependent LLM class oxidoreductase n=1 Tax=Kitasatospora sp. NPDC093558 TaxID=3155201 RepID=UPI00341950DA